MRKKSNSKKKLYFRKKRETNETIRRSLQKSVKNFNEKLNPEIF